MTTPPLGLHNVCTFQFCCRWGDRDFESGPACLIQVTDQLITAWGVRVSSNRRQGRGHQGSEREKKLVPSVLLNSTVSPSQHLTLSGLQSSCHLSFTSGPDLTWQEPRHIQWQLQAQQSFNSLDRNQSLGFWEGQETLYPSINTNIQMIFYSSNFPQNNLCVVGLKSLIIMNRHFQVVNER